MHPRNKENALAIAAPSTALAVSLPTRSFCLCWCAEVGVDGDAVSLWLFTSGSHFG